MARVMPLLILLFSILVDNVLGKGGYTASWPLCAVECLKEQLPLSNCSVSDEACFCSHADLMHNTFSCSDLACSYTDYYGFRLAVNDGCTIVPAKGPNSCVIIISVMCAAALFMVVIRLLARSMTSQHGWDDVLVGVSWLLAFPLTITAGLLYKLRLGEDQWTFSLDELSELLLVGWVEAMIYLAATGVPRIALLVFYLRIFPGHAFRMVVFVTMGLCVSVLISFLVTYGLECVPSSYIWRQVYPQSEGKCISPNFGIAQAVIYTSLDIAIMILPMPILWKLHVDWRKKIQIVTMFSFGLIVVTVSIIRLRLIIRLVKSKNVTHDYYEIIIWDSVEAYTSVICVCLPAAKVFFARSFSLARESLSQHTQNWLPFSSFIRQSKYPNGHQRIASDERHVMELEKQISSRICSPRSTYVFEALPDPAATYRWTIQGGQRKASLINESDSATAPDRWL